MAKRGRPALDAEESKEPIFKQNVKRRTSETRGIWSDLFKLTVGLYVKRIGLAKTPDEDPADFVDAEHVHFFRTYDSNGKKLDRCNPIANHFHVVETAPNPDDPDGAPHVLSVSGPMKMIKTRKQGRWVLEPGPLNDYDFHTHGVDYVKSGQVQARVTNIEAQKVLAFEAQKGAPVAGVLER